MLIEPALLQFVDSVAAILDHRHAVFDAGGKHEAEHGV